MSHSYLPLSWSYVSIGSVCEPVQSVNPQNQGDETFTYIDISSIDNVHKQITQTQIIDSNNAPSRARQLVAVNDILVSTVRPNLNAVALVPNNLDQQICSTGFCVLRPKQDLLDAKFLFFWVQSSNFIQNLVSKARGIGYPSVSDRDVKTSNIPLPPLSEQRRIAAILRQANELRQLRRQADERAGELIPALMQEFLADNKHHLSTIELGKIATTMYGSSVKATEYPSEGMPILRIPNVVSGRLDYRDMKFVKLTNTDKEILKLEDGDVLVVRTNGNPDYVGRATAYIDDGIPRTFASYLIRIKVNRSQIDPEFLADYINHHFGRRQILNQISTSAGQNNVNSKALAAIRVPFLTKQARQTYLEIRQRILHLENDVGLTVNFLDNLFSSLLTQAFTGELTESWRETHHKQLQEEAIQRDIALGLRGQEPTIGDLAAGKATTAELEKVNERLAQISEQLQSIQSSAFQEFIAKTFGDISKIDINSLLASNTQGLQTMQVNMQELLSTQMAPVSSLLAEQLSGVTQQFQVLYSEILSRSAFQPSPDLSKQFIELFSNLLQIGSASQLLSSRKALQDSLSKELRNFINRIAEAPAYFRSDDLIDENISLLQVEDQLRLLKALGIVREVRVRGQMGYRLVSNERDYATPEGLDT